jgi:hypothetical protein
MHKLIRSASIIGLVVGALSLGGCATRESVLHAQTTADNALSLAQSANTGAQSAASAAQSAANAAQSAANAAQSAANAAQAASVRLYTVEGNLDHLMNHHEHGTWRNVGVAHGAFKRMPTVTAPTGGK